ncbi:MAG: hypothetical protein K5770_05520 [Lachnospiraceae bacterium]|nr:hypothetical protein [Lachnospiraceae bacterium]
MNAVTKNETLAEMLAGIGIWGALWLIGILLFSKDRLHGVIGLIAGLALAVFYIINLYRSIEGALDFDEKGAVAYTRKKYLIRYLVVCIVYAAVAWTGIGNVITCFAGIIGIKIGAYLQPFVRRYIFRRIDEKAVAETDTEAAVETDIDAAADASAIGMNTDDDAAFETEDDDGAVFDTDVSDTENNEAYV